ncbi:MAG: hypothetical protein U0L06_11220, partial [Agathobacter sp.]|nr:hypothetical protein [Agathobacter sp.]
EPQCKETEKYINSDLSHLLLWQSQAALYEVACFLCPETNRKLRFSPVSYIIYLTPFTPNGAEINEK